MTSGNNPSHIPTPAMIEAGGGAITAALHAGRLNSATRNSAAREIYLAMEAAREPAPSEDVACIEQLIRFHETGGHEGCGSDETLTGAKVELAWVRAGVAALKDNQPTKSECIFCERGGFGPHMPTKDRETDLTMDTRRENEVLRAAIDDSQATLAAIRATTRSDEWPEAADHFHKLCGETMQRNRAALTNTPTVVGDGQ